MGIELSAKQAECVQIEVEGGGAMLEFSTKQNEYICKANKRWNLKVG